VSAAVRDFAARVKKLDGENPAIRRGGPWPMVWALGFAVFMALYGGGFLSYGLKNLAGFGFTLCLVMIPLSLFFGKPRMTAREKEKKALVERFIAPNTREDLLEFFAFALAQLEDTDVISAVSLRIGALVSGEKKYRLLWDRVWKTKCRQTYVKARLAMSGDQETLRDITDMLRRAKAL
jgi:hypothetical protein